MEIKTVKINELKPHPKNPRVHPDSAIDKLVRSIKEYGWTNPVLVSADGYVLSGHARLKAAEKAGIEEVPVIYLPLEGAKAEAYLIADNRLQDETDWDYEKLKDLLQELDTGEFDLELTGFDMEEIEDLIAQLHVPEEIIEDEVPEPPEEPITKPGDLWILGRHRLLCGDATVAADVERLMGGKKADMVFTDPPYNVNYGEKASMLNDYQKGHRNTSSIKNDNMKKDDFLRFLIDSFKSIYVALCPGGAFYICHAESTGLEFRKAVLEAGFLLKQCIIWAKNSLVIGRQDYQWKHEPILYGWKPGVAHRWYGGRKNTTVIEDNAQVVIEKQDDHAIIHLSLGVQQLAIKVSDYEVIFDGDDNLTTVWRIEKPQRNDVHPTMKPVGLCARAIGNSSKPGEIVLDVFGGSGSTLIAAEQLNRTCYMMELDPIYCDVIIKRWENFTGQKAVLAE